MMTRQPWIVLLALLLVHSFNQLLAAASVPSTAPASTQRASTTQPSLRQADQLHVLEAVFRHQFDKNASAQQQGGGYFFLALDDGTDPPAELLARFKQDTPPVLPVSMAGPSRRGGVKHKVDGKSGLIFRATTIAWLDADTAEVEGGYYEGGLSASGNICKVERRGGKWTVTGDGLKWIA